MFVGFLFFFFYFFVWLSIQKEKKSVNISGTHNVQSTSKKKTGIIEWEYSTVLIKKKNCGPLRKKKKTVGLSGKKKTAKSTQFQIDMSSERKKDKKDRSLFTEEINTKRLKTEEKKTVPSDLAADPEESDPVQEYLPSLNIVGDYLFDYKENFADFKNEMFEVTNFAEYAIHISDSKLENIEGWDSYFNVMFINKKCDLMAFGRTSIKVNLFRNLFFGNGTLPDSFEVDQASLKKFKITKNHFIEIIQPAMDDKDNDFKITTDDQARIKENIFEITI